ncbi:MAG: hypothetical protein WCD18_08370 [Thermosynechococcaceae cyanobacterium]
MPTSNCSFEACHPLLVAAKNNIDPQTGFPIIEEKDWFKGEVPLATPVLIHPEMGDNYIAVLERQLQGGVDGPSPFRVNDLGFSSLWSRSSIKLFGSGLNQGCVYFICVKKSFPILIHSFSIKIGDTIFRSQDDAHSLILDSQRPTDGQIGTIFNNSAFRSPSVDGQFTIANSLALALKNAAPKPVFIRLWTEGGVSITKKISAKTIEAWQVIYKDIPNEEPTPVSTPIPNSPASPSALTTQPSEVVLNPNVSIPPIQPDAQPKYPVVDGSVWQTGEDIPRFEPVWIKDEFDGNYVAVIDRNQKTGWTSYKTLVSKWSAHALQVVITKRSDGRFLMFTSSPLTLKIGPQTFMLEGTENSFPISSDLARVLADPPSGEATLSYRDLKGNLVTHNLNPKTVQSWKAIYKGSSAN